jgi:antitoxin component YwqK of YwqJK toxin-antitoxin module
MASSMAEVCLAHAGCSYYKNGRLQFEGQWQGGEPHGPGKVYNQHGKLLFEGDWKGGKSSAGIFMERYKNML